MIKSKICLVFINTALFLMNWLYRVLSPLAERLMYHKHAQYVFQPRADDIFIITYPKSGTTWVAAILHQLIGDGNMSFDHIDRVCPWFPLPGASLDMKSPRIFKSHWNNDFFPKLPGRFIYVYRNGMDVAASWCRYNQRQSHNGSFDHHFDNWLKDCDNVGPWASHVAGWLKNKRGLNVLYLKYEDILADTEGAVRKIAAFCNLDLKESDMPRILERSSFGFMKNHENQFDPRAAHAYRFGFFGKGQANQGKTQLSPDQINRIKDQYTKYLAESNLNYF